MTAQCGEMETHLANAVLLLASLLQPRPVGEGNDARRRLLALLNGELDAAEAAAARRLGSPSD